MQRERIGARIEALGISQFEAATSAGLNRYAVYDLLAGRKEMIRTKAVISLASVLDCDPEYLTGVQETPRKAATPSTEANHG